MYLSVCTKLIHALLIIHQNVWNFSRYFTTSPVHWSLILTIVWPHQGLDRHFSAASRRASGKIWLRTPPRTLDVASVARIRGWTTVAGTWRRTPPTAPVTPFCSCSSLATWTMFVAVWPSPWKINVKWVSWLLSSWFNSRCILLVVYIVLDSLNNWGEGKKRCLILKLQVEHWPFTKHSYTVCNSFQELKFEISSSF